MDSSESISLLNQLILPNVELKNYHNSREYLKWFLGKSYNFFTSEGQLDFAKIKHFSFNHSLSKNIKNVRLTVKPCLLSTKELSNDKSLQLRYDLLAFVVAISIVEKGGNLILRFYVSDFSREETERILKVYGGKNKQTL